VDDCSIRRGVTEALSRPHHLAWFRTATGFVVQDGQHAADIFFENADNFDFSPFRFFDPQWFRSRYRVDGPNAFLSYLRNSSQRLAVPSPLFAPRWYTRRYRLSPAIHPLLDYLRCDDRNDPHPLIDLAYLNSQDPGLEHRASEGGSGDETARQKDQAVSGYLTDASQFRLKPHPLFDSGWYLDNNPDVAAAGMNPLEHYLQFGHLEGRNPNRLFSVKWYKQTYLDRLARSKAEPLAAYLVYGYTDQHAPLPGLKALTKPSIKFTRHGPQPLIESLRTGKSIFADLRHRPNIHVGEFTSYMSGRVQDYNPSLPEQSIILREKRIAVMYTPKCASAKLLYWWQEQSGLLEAALKFANWSHSFEYLYRMSRAYLDDALTFDPARYAVYKFVRNPLFRVVSSFTHLLAFPDYFGLRTDDKRLSFMGFLEQLEATNYFDNEPHFTAQFTKLEEEGIVRPHILKIEEGMDTHLRALEGAHGLPSTTYQNHPEIRQMILSHAKQGRRNRFVGPHVRIPYYSIPDQKMLLTSEAVSKICELYRVDFEAYGYRKEPISG